MTTNGHTAVAPPQRRFEVDEDTRHTERLLLGAVFDDPSILAGVLGDLEVRHFAHHPHQVVFAAFRNLAARGVDICLDTVAAELEKIGKLEAAGDYAFLGELQLVKPITREVERRRDRLYLLAGNRELRAAAGELLHTIETWPHDPAELRTEVLARFTRRLAELGGATREGDLLAIAPLAFEVALADRPPIRSYPSGFAGLDALVGGGVSTRQLLTLLGPPGAGKSALAVELALRVARTIPVLYASTELEAHELACRIGGNLLDRPWSALVRGHAPRDWVIKALDGVRIRVLGCDVLPRDGAKALELIERTAAAIATTCGVAPLVIVDYLQDLARGGTERDVRGRVGDMATELRAMSQRLDAAMIAVSSVSRSYYSEKRAADLRAMDDPTVYLAAAKEAGDVDYAAATVVFLDVGKHDGAAERPARLAVAKARHGQAGFAGARFAGASGRWRESDDSVRELSSPGRAAVAVDAKLDDADRDVLAAVEKLHRRGDRLLCTKSQLRTGCGVATNRVAAALERLVHVGKLRLVEVERMEGGKIKKREIYELVAGPDAPAEEPAKPLELDLERPSPGLHGGGL